MRGVLIVASLILFSLSTNAAEEPSDYVCMQKKDRGGDVFNIVIKSRVKKSFLSAGFEEKPCQKSREDLVASMAKLCTKAQQYSPVIKERFFNFNDVTIEQVCTGRVE